MSSPTGDPAVTTLKFAVSGMHCPSCGLLIDESLEDIAGVLRSTTDVGNERTVVELAGYPVVEPSQLLEAITAEGYGARIVE